MNCTIPSKYFWTHYCTIQSEYFWMFTVQCNHSIFDQYNDSTFECLPFNTIEYFWMFTVQYNHSTFQHTTDFSVFLNTQLYNKIIVFLNVNCTIKSEYFWITVYNIILNTTIKVLGTQSIGNSSNLEPVLCDLCNTIRVFLNVYCTMQS